jgi:hypothetical protein
VLTRILPHESRAKASAEGRCGNRALQGNARRNNVLLQLYDLTITGRV